MQVKENISSNLERKALKDFIPLVFAFYGCMILLSFYQNLRLFFDGVLDSFFNKSLFLLIMHHSGFGALAALLLSFLFNYLERKTPHLGYKVSIIVLSVLILIEGALIEHYIQNYEALGYGRFSLTEVIRAGYSIIPILITLVVLIFLFLWFGKITKSLYNVVSRTYPLTIILFSLFLAVLNSAKKPINENKTQHYLESAINIIFDFNKYEGDIEYPMAKELNALKELDHHKELGKYFELSTKKPNIVVLIIDGFGSDFIGNEPKYKGFTPFLESLSKQSLFWNNHLSNTGESFAALPSIMGSLPFGKTGFTNLSGKVNRQTIFSLLKENGYKTSFSYGGNSALNGLDRFLDEERVDQILDKKGFGEGYQMQDEDAAGISLGYPDKELFKKWLSLDKPIDKPRLDVFLTLSTKKPFLAPNLHTYEEKVDSILINSKMGRRTNKVIKKNKEVFASLIYADKALEEFIQEYKEQPNYNNTIFMVTGSHNLKELPQEDNLGRYKVPLMVFGPLLKFPKRIEALVSHADIAPSILSMLHKKYELKMPNQVAWLGDNLIHYGVFEKTKQIPLFRDKKNIKDYIHENLFVSGTNVYEINTDLELESAADDAQIDQAKDNFKSFRAINNYVTANNKILPDSEAMYAEASYEFTKTEMVWLQSVFNGSDFDNAYKTARELAFDKDWDRALLLSNYILSQIPRHADAEVLKGRVYSWKKDYKTSISLLKEAIRKYPTYTDAYSALLDTYYWSENIEEVTELFKTISRNDISSHEIEAKIIRAKEQIRNMALKKATEQAKKESNMVSADNK
ncbi:sulfatase-like hydrolase/transferase [Maribacter sp. HTCC2170]|uniref:sulfatase-like hydrolase/transferase n=1 Tax=Maribacter sp. (strain HTCC2170 / KCCM 42371) TaxID=313603 RepID=UPI00006AFD54|nr:sulfatase-like hydrolase/transferase [Maribacter sp. HTCC2170]EAR01293.1 Sulfatase [Maribacter sp. HTCC2170]